MRAALSLAVLQACCACAFSLDPSLDVSQYLHKAWNNREGFPSALIHAIAQTPDGYLWLGTEFGLLKFDGVHAVPWQPPPNQHLPGDKIQSLLVTSDGTLWIGTWKGLASWKDGKLTQYPELAKEVIFPLMEDREGAVWAGGFAYSPPGKLCSIQRGVVKCYGEDGSLGNGVLGLYEDRKSNLWAGTLTGLWRWKPSPRKFYPIAGEPAGIQGMAEDDSGELLIALHGRVARLDGGKLQTVYRYPVPARRSFVRTRLRDRDGSLWLGTVDHGLVHVHQGRVDSFTQSDGLSGNTVTALFEDREGNVWVATTGGLDRFREFPVSSISVKRGLSDVLVTSVLAAKDGSVWMGTADGLNRWKDGTISVYRTRNGLPDDYLESLYEDDRGRIWISTRRGVAYFENGRFVPIGGVPSGIVYAMAEDTTRNLWVSNLDHGLVQLSGGHLVRQIPWIGLGHKDVAMTLAADPLHGGLWLGFFQGGVSYWKDDQVRVSYTAASGLGKGAVINLRVDREGTLWAATEGGLSRLKDGRVATLSSKNGLPCDQVLWSIEDDDSSLWLYTSCGLVRISSSEVKAWESDPNRSAQVTVFDVTDGVRSRADSPSANPKAGKSPDGRIWFITSAGVSVVDPRNLRVNMAPPPVYIERITADRKIYDTKPNLRLPPLVRDLEIDYTALSFVSPEKNSFRYRLEGRDRDWVDAGSRRQAFYDNLPPGNYRFRVIASNNSGVWNEEGASLVFSVDPAYYQTNWFRALCLVTFLAMLWTIYHVRVRALNRRQAILVQHQAEIQALNEQMIKSQEAERIRISGELHDSVLQQITSLALRLGTVKYQVPPDSEAKATINDLRDELIKIGTDIRQVSHELHPALLHDSGLPAALSSYCEEFSRARGLGVECETDQSVKDLSPEAALCLYRVAQEALGNAAKYSEAKQVNVRLTRSEGQVGLSVSDDGVGCDPTQILRAGGLGVINMRERVLQLDGTFEFDSEPGRGTRVKVTVPFRTAS